MQRSSFQVKLTPTNNQDSTIISITPPTLTQTSLGGQHLSERLTQLATGLGRNIKDHSTIKTQLEAISDEQENETHQTLPYTLIDSAADSSYVSNETLIHRTMDELLTTTQQDMTITSGDTHHQVSSESLNIIADGQLSIHLKVVQDGEARARRIAAVYAKFYLEHSDVNGNAKYKGRHFWMGLGAFASKTIADALGHWSTSADGGLFGVVYNFKLGNFWLYQDIAGWHFEYNQCSSNFSSCISQRNSNNYIPEVKTMVYDSHGAYNVLPKIRNLGASQYIKPAFDATKKFEKTPPDRTSKRKAQQRINLMQLANHEQREVLQKIIYQKSGFRAGLGFAEFFRGNLSIPEIQMVYTSEADTKDADLKNIAPADIKLADITKRMKWITSVAEQFIKLMNNDITKVKVEREMVKIAGWTNKT